MASAAAIPKAARSFELGRTREDLFDPDDFGVEAAHDSLREGIALFEAGDYHSAHEAFERCWLSAEGGDADFFKGLIQAAICLHHLLEGNLEGARKLYAGHRRLLAPFLPEHRGVDLTGFLAEMQRTLGPVLRGEACVDPGLRPRLPARKKL